MNHKEALHGIRKIADVSERLNAMLAYVFEIRKYDAEKALELCDEILTSAKEHNVKEVAGRAYNHKAYCHAIHADYTWGLECLEKAEKLARKINNKALLARVFKNYGTIKRELGLLSDAFTYYEKALLLNEKLGEEMEKANVLLQISNLHLDLYEYENALEYAQLALPILENNTDKNRIAEAYFTLGNIYFKQEKFDKARKAYKKVKRMTDKESRGFMLAEIGRGKVAYRTEKEEKALERLRNGLALAEQHENTEGYITSNFYIGRVLCKIQDYAGAMQHIQKAFEAAKTHSRRHDVMSIHGVLAELYEKVNDLPKAYEHLKKYEQLKEEIFQENTINKLRHLQTKQEIQLATKEKEVAEKTATLKQQFIANMSHEIRTPMNAIVGMSRMLWERDPKEDQKKYLSAIRQSADSLLVIINDILDFSKMEAGKVRIEKINFSLKDCLKNVVNILRIKAEEKGLKLWFEMSDNVPKNVTGDPTRLTQVLINLVGNAIKFTEKGRVDIQVFLEKVENERHYVHFQVIDTGIGISEDYVNKIFESFTQAGTDLARKFGGTGLGLTISKELISLMEGDINVKSVLNEGTTFEFCIPFAISKGVHVDAVETVFELTKKELLCLNNATILLAEDNEFNRILAEDILLEMAPNINILSAENGIDVLEVLEEHEVDLILMDIQMPVKNGLEATKEIRASNKTLPIIAMTANVMQDDIENYLANGMNDHIPKPFMKEDLFTKMLAQLDQEKILAEAQNEIPNPKKNELVIEEKENTNPIIDDTFLKSFTGGNPDKMKKYLNLFKDNAPLLMDKIALGIQNETYDDIKIGAHSLKSQLRYLGVPEDVSGVLLLEQMGNNNAAMKSVRKQFDKLNSIFSRLIKEVEERISALT